MNLNANLRYVDHPATQRSTAVPLVRGSFTASQTTLIATVATWSAAQRRIVLERLDSEITKIYASPSFYWGRAPALTGTRLRIRPSTP